MSKFWSAIKRFFGFAAKEAIAHPDIVKAGVESITTKNPAPIVAAVEEAVDKKTGL